MVRYAECKGSLSGSMCAYTRAVANLHVASSTLITVSLGIGIPESSNIDRSSLTL